MAGSAGHLAGRTAALTLPVPTLPELTRYCRHRLLCSEPTRALRCKRWPKASDAWVAGPSSVPLHHPTSLLQCRAVEQPGLAHS